MRYVFVHSPLLGPSTWRSVAALLRGDVPDLRPFTAAEPPLWRSYVDLAAHGQPAGEELVVVGHSGAGPMLPALAHVLSAEATVFVDAVVPPAGGVYTTPENLRRLIDQHADGAWLRPWTTWWTEDVLHRNLPDPTLRAVIESEQPRVPLGFYDEAIPMPNAWSDRACGYVMLSAAYAADADDAEWRGWPVERLDFGHLATLTHPELAAAAIEGVTRRAVG